MSCLYSKVKEVLYKHTVFAKPLYFCKLAGSLSSQGKKGRYHTQAPLRPFPQAQFIVWNANFTKQHSTRLLPLTKAAPKGPCNQEPTNAVECLGLQQDSLDAFPFAQIMAQDEPVPVLLSHLLRLKGAASIICFLFFMFHFFFYSILCFHR